MLRAIYDGGDIFYKVLGTGSPIILIHGYLMSSEAWGALPGMLSDRHRVIIPDLPGHGQSAAYPSVHTMEFMAGAVHSVLHAEGIEKAHIIGHSMGGYVALAFLELFPDWVQSISLLNSIPFADTPEKRARRDEVIALVEGRRFEFFLKLVIQDLLRATNHRILEKKLVEHAIHQGRESIIATTNGIKQRPDRSGLLKVTHVPFYWIMSRNDTQFDVPAILSRVKEQGLPEATILNTGHMSFLEQAPLVARHITSFIDALNH